MRIWRNKKCNTNKLEESKWSVFLEHPYYYADRLEPLARPTNSVKDISSNCFLPLKRKIPSAASKWRSCGHSPRLWCHLPRDRWLCMHKASQEILSVWGVKISSNGRRGTQPCKGKRYNTTTAHGNPPGTSSGVVYCRSNKWYMKIGVAIVYKRCRRLEGK